MTGSIYPSAENATDAFGGGAQKKTPHQSCDSAERTVDWEGNNDRSRQSPGTRVASATRGLGQSCVVSLGSQILVSTAYYRFAAFRS